MSNPLEDWPVSDGGTWDDHIERGSLGGTDYAVPKGTPIPAVIEGDVEINLNNGTGGYTARQYKTPNSYIEYLHLSVLPREGHYLKGQVVGLTGGRRGDPGAGNSTGAHLHIHGVIDGVRVPYTDLIENTEIEDEMAKLIPELALHVDRPSGNQQFYGITPVSYVMLDTEAERERYFRAFGGVPETWTVFYEGEWTTFTDLVDELKR